MENVVLFPLMHKNIIQLPMYITGISLRYLEEGVVRENGFNNYQWAFSISGKGKIIIEDESYVLEEGIAFFFRKDVPHRYYSVEEPWYIQWITFDGTMLEGLFDFMGIQTKEIITLIKNQEMNDMLKKMVYLLQDTQNNEDAMLKASSLLYKFLIHMNEMVKQENKNPKQRLINRLKPIINRMNANINQVVTLEEMAEIIGINKYYFCKMFKEAYGMTPVCYFNHIKIQKAKEYIINDHNMRIKDIAQAVGFNDTSYFCVTFKKIEGCTPLEFKTKYRNN